MSLKINFRCGGGISGREAEGRSHNHMEIRFEPYKHPGWSLSSTQTSIYNPIMSVIVVGGGLAGLSAAHTLLERGANVLLLDKQG